MTDDPDPRIAPHMTPLEIYRMMLEDRVRALEDKVSALTNAKTEPEVQPEPVGMPASTERALDRIGELVEHVIQTIRGGESIYRSPSCSREGDRGDDSIVEVSLLVHPHSRGRHVGYHRPTDLTLVVSRFRGTAIDRETVVIPATAREVDDIDAAANEAWWKIRRRIEASIETTRVIDQLAHTLET